MILTEGISVSVPAVRTGSDVDLAALVETYATLLFRVAHSVLRNRSEAEDTVQDTFVRVLEHSRKLAEVRDLRVWLVRICWNLALDRKRRIRPQQMDDLFADALPGAGVPADQALAQQHEMRLVLAGLERLPAAERQALLLSTLDDLSTAEIAAIMNRSEAAVRALTFRARARLRSRLEGGSNR